MIAPDATSAHGSEDPLGFLEAATTLRATPPRETEEPPQSVTAWKPFQATHSGTHPAQIAAKTPSKRAGRAASSCGRSCCVSGAISRSTRAGTS